MKSPRACVPVMAFLLCSCSTAPPPGGAAPAPMAAAGDSRSQADTQADGGTGGRPYAPEGTKVQGTRLHGTRGVVAVLYAGARLHGGDVLGLQLSGTVLSGQRGGARVSGADLQGATLTGQDGSGQPVPLQISAVAADPQVPGGEVLLYTVLLPGAAPGTWDNLCDPDPQGGQFAIPLSGVWDPASGAYADDATRFTLACTSGALAKCVRWGYWPWVSLDGVPLRDAHQSCTRMARADYCGDGRSHTRDGTRIDIYDDLGVEHQSPGDGMLFEAAWTPEGAYCVSKARWDLIGATLLLECPQKITLPAPGDLLPPDICAERLSPHPRSQSPLSNRSFIELAL